MNNDQQLWNAIYALYHLLVSRVNHEDEYQHFFERHPAAFSTLGIDEAKSFEKRSGHSLPFDKDRNFRPEPDFIGVNRGSGLVTVIELKTPFVGDITTARSDGNRAKFKADTEGYISQATEYVDSIRERPEARDVIRTTFGIERIATYSIVLICALENENNPALISALTSQRKTPTALVFYDTLLEALIASYSTPRRDKLSRPGWCFVFHLAISTQQVHARAHIGEYGTGGVDRLSIFLEGDDLVFECIDSGGYLHTMSSPLTGTGPHYVRFEFSNDQNGIYMSLNVNNVEQDLRVGCRSLNFSPDTSMFTLGADSEGNRGAAFILLNHHFINRTMDLVEKLESFHYFEQRARGNIFGIEFKPESYMVRNPLGHLAQDRDECKPQTCKLVVGEQYV